MEEIKINASDWLIKQVRAWRDKKKVKYGDIILWRCPRCYDLNANTRLREFYFRHRKKENPKVRVFRCSMCFDYEIEVVDEDTEL